MTKSNSLSVSFSGRNLALDLEQIQREKLTRSLSRFVAEAWPIIEPGRTYSDNWHIGYLCEHLEAITHGELRRLIINIPPRSMKSLLASVLWPAWEWARKPATSAIFSTYAISLARDHSRNRRRLVQSDWYRRRWGDKVCLTTDSIDEVSNNQNGTWFSRGTGGGGLGRGGERVIIDDPHTTAGAESEVQREATLDDYDHHLVTRLNDPQTGAIVLIMQRLNHKDMTGHILGKEAAQWTHVKLPATEDAPGGKTYSFPRSGRTRRREQGDILWPARYPQHVLDALKESMGRLVFEGQFQQRPVPSEGGLFSRKEFRYFDPLNPPFLLEAVDQALQSWDMAFKDTKDSAYVVGQVWVRRGANRFLVDQVRRKMDFRESLQAVIAMSNKHPYATAKLIEDKANGPAVISALRDTIPGIIAVEPHGGKESRAQPYSVLVEAGNIWVPTPESTPWVEDFLLEHEHAPKGDYWDQIDAASQAQIYMRGNGSNLLGNIDDLLGSTRESMTEWT